MEDDEKETISIPCPLCSEEHEYPLKITRSRTLSLITSASFREEQPRWKRVRLYVICPIKNQKFILKMRLPEFSSERINAVEVGEPIKK